MAVPLESVHAFSFTIGAHGARAGQHNVHSIDHRGYHVATLQPKWAHDFRVG